MQSNPFEAYYLDLLKNKYAQFNGRARRSEYWYFVLFNFIVALGLGMVTAFVGIGMGFLNYAYSLAVLIPSIAVGIRRLQDTGRHGLWLLVGFVPLVGWIVLLVFLVQDSQPIDNQYGPNPKKAAVVI